MDIRTLGLRFSTGGEPELEELVNHYGEKLLRYATSILCDYQEAEDIVQRVFLAAYQNRKKFDGKNLSGWLYKITYRHCLNQLKKQKLLFFADLGNVREEGHDPYGDFAISDEVLRALRRLSPKERALLFARIENEQSYEALSLLFGRSPAALRKQYERAKKKLAGYLNAEKMHGKESEHARRQKQI